MSEENILNKISQERMLRNAYHHLRHKYRHTYLWAFVMDICGTGSNAAYDICIELGWNPNEKGSKELPPRK